MAVLTVSQLNFYIKSLLDNDKNLRSVYLKAEISNFTDHYRTGHLYLSLKDEKCTVRAVMFAGNASRLKFKPEDGMKVLVRGYVSVYNISGQYQFYIEDMQPDGIGALSMAFEQLKRKLTEEGLFDSEHKQPLPLLPKRIGVITSPTGAAVQDICRILKRRYPIGEIIMCPVLVQGENAAAQLTNAVRHFNRLNCADVIIIGRGGGSMEDLWAFNDEGLARAIYDSKIPVVSGVGHETDFTICDFVSDVRASTPSAAAELVSPEDGALYGNLEYYQRKIISAVKMRITLEKSRLDGICSANVLRSPEEMIREKQIHLDFLTSELKSAYRDCLLAKTHQFSALTSKLDALSPLRVLSRGYTIASENGNVISSAEKIKIGSKINIKFADGSADCTVTERTLDNEKSGL
ncbi:MAG: exodeoxyribonuclease VII large subunit [Clostridia bacterium]|nr:exodeoxyribonuclease VII large subunit [Clostridia bacterium]